VDRSDHRKPGDGGWIAYESVDSGRPEVYLRCFPDVTRGKWPVSSGGGSQPVWARNGKEIFYLDTAGMLMSVRVEGKLAPTLGPPTKVLDASAYVRNLVTYASRHYDVSLDGQRFIMLKPSAQPDKSNAPRTITVVENWFEELKRVVPKQ
jgi:serine/threonine-protein kinase